MPRHWAPVRSAGRKGRRAPTDLDLPTPGKERHERMAESVLVRADIGRKPGGGDPGIRSRETPMASLTARVLKFVRGREGRGLADKAGKLARAPGNRRRLEQVRARLSPA